MGEMSSVGRPQVLTEGIVSSQVWSNEDTSRNSARLGQDVKVASPALSK